MVNLREQRKIENQKKIIEVASDFFSNKGFQQTTISEIAKQAQVGVGTIYNYYSSKGVLLLAVFSNFMERLKDEGQQEIQINKGNIIELLTGFMKRTTLVFEQFPKTFWREIFHVMTDETDETRHLRKSLFGFDQEIISWVETIIEAHSDCFRVSVNRKEASTAIYGAAMTLVMLYIYDDQMTYDQFLIQLENQIKFIFLGKLLEG
ncbi:TetR/AcrR family transcriptional regulator [Fictibacillus enclensis]|uniref:TetR/AcrR family transcriptional regulator n=1 Tax=Fictibacillus enclensis TaxID=1017270 RepID=UPI0025A257AD|nr:TetR/AcrR family transcriptional regulator [Fictibacillus enclensis]MDM5197238.1 TetR/AcrR family transcriptional regulator [Fictibacillus enclensis]